MITVKVNGKEFEGFTSVSVTESVDNLCQQFNLTCSAGDGFNFPIKRGSTLEVLIDNVTIFSGNAEVVKGGYSADSYSVKVDGRSIAKEIIKSDLKPKFNLKGPISLKSVMEKALKSSGLDFQVENLAGSINDFKTNDVLTDDVGTKIFDFWLDLARKRKVLISSDRTERIIYINRPNTEKYEDFSINNYVDNIRGLNNVHTADFEFNDTERVNEYNVYSQEPQTAKRANTNTDPNAVNTGLFPEQPEDSSGKSLSAANEQKKAELTELLNKFEPGSEAYLQTLQQIESLGASTKQGTEFRRSRVSTKGTATDSAITDNSIRHFVAEVPSDNDDCKELAQWHANTERVKSVSYTCTLIEFFPNDEPWKAGVLIDVFDEIASIDATMLINTVEFTSSVSEDGSAEEVVNLTLTIPDGYSGDATASDSQTQTNTIGENWNLQDFQ